MRQRNHRNPHARTGQRAWLKLVHALLHLGLVFGGTFGLPQTVAAAAAAAAQDAPGRGELTLAREGVRLALAAAAEKRGGPDPSPATYPTPAVPAAGTLLKTAAHAKPVAFVPRLRSKHRAHGFQARAPPRTS